MKRVRSVSGIGVAYAAESKNVLLYLLQFADVAFRTSVIFVELLEMGHPDALSYAFTPYPLP